MRALKVCLLVMTASLATALATTAASGEDPAPSNTIKVGVIGSLFRDLPEPVFQALAKPLKTLLDSQTGRTSQLVCGGDAEYLGGQLAKDRVQLAVFNGFEFAWARLKYPEIKPLMIAVNQHQHLKAVLVTNRDSPVAMWANLQGKTLALPRLSREHCRLFLERRCEGCGQKAEAFFAQITRSLDVEDALDAVVDGQVNAAVVDGVSLDNFQKRKPGRFARLKIVQESETFPCAVLAYHPGALDETFVKKFRDGMVSTSQTRRGQQLLTLCQLSGFEHIPEDYEQLLTEIARAYPPPAPHVTPAPK